MIKNTGKLEIWSSIQDHLTLWWDVENYLGMLRRRQVGSSLLFLICLFIENSE